LGIPDEGYSRNALYVLNFIINHVCVETLTTDESKNIVGNNILFNSSSKLSFIKYKLMLKLHEENPSKFEWLSYTKSILDDSDFEFHLECTDYSIKIQHFRM
jgi:hypothetical protein